MPSNSSKSHPWSTPQYGVPGGQDRPVGPTHAVDAATGAAICGIKADRLKVLDQDWEAACIVEKCTGCFTVAHNQ